MCVLFAAHPKGLITIIVRKFLPVWLIKALCACSVGNLPRKGTPTPTALP